MNKNMIREIDEIHRKLTPRQKEDSRECLIAACPLKYIGDKAEMREWKKAVDKYVYEMAKMLDWNKIMRQT